MMSVSTAKPSGLRKFFREVLHALRGPDMYFSHCMQRADATDLQQHPKDDAPEFRVPMPQGQSDAPALNALLSPQEVTVLWCRPAGPTLEATGAMGSEGVVVVNSEFRPRHRDSEPPGVTEWESSLFVPLGQLGSITLPARRAALALHEALDEANRMEEQRAEQETAPLQAKRSHDQSIESD